MRCEGDKTYLKPGDCPVCGMHLVKIATFGAKGAVGHSDDEVLRLAASVDKQSGHPLAAAIVAAAEGKELQLLAISDFTSLTGMGVRARVGEHFISVGNDKLVRKSGSGAAYDENSVRELQGNGHTVMFVLEDERVVGIIGVTDPIKASTPEAQNQGNSA